LTLLIHCNLSNETFIIDKCYILSDPEKYIINDKLMLNKNDFEYTENNYTISDFIDQKIIKLLSKQNKIELHYNQYKNHNYNDDISIFNNIDELIKYFMDITNIKDIQELKHIKLVEDTGKYCFVYNDSNLGYILK